MSRSIVFFNRFYWPDIAATGQMLTDLAEDLAAQGWTVTVVASDSTYDDSRAAPLPSEERHNGVRVLRVGGARFGRHRLIGRMLAYLTYMAGAFLRAVRLPRQDVVCAMSDPPFMIAVALLVARIRGGRTVYWVQDLFPQIAAPLGVLRARSPGYRIADRMARWLNRRCDLVIALGPRMAHALAEAGARPARITFVHNWADSDAIRPIDPTENDFLDEHDLRGRFVVLYSGNAGRAHTFDAVLHAIRELRGDPDVVFLFIGGGNRMAELRDTANRESLGNMRFLGYMPRERLAWSLSAASVSLVTEDPGVVGLLVPSKTYGILASGRPLIFVGDPSSDVARVVTDAACGAVLAPTDGAGLVATLMQWREDPHLVGSLGRRARAAAEERYDRRRSVARWHAAVSALLAGRADFSSWN